MRIFAPAPRLKDVGKRSSDWPIWSSFKSARHPNRVGQTSKQHRPDWTSGRRLSTRHGTQRPWDNSPWPKANVSELSGLWPIYQYWQKYKQKNLTSCWLRWQYLQNIFLYFVEFNLKNNNTYYMYFFDLIWYISTIYT